MPYNNAFLSPITGARYPENPTGSVHTNNGAMPGMFITAYPKLMMRLKAFKDGLSKTLLVAEIAGRGAPSSAVAYGPWAGENNLTTVPHLPLASGTPPWINPDPTTAVWDAADKLSLYSEHAGGVNVVFCDGSVHFLNDATTLPVLLSLVSRDGSEMIGESDY